jgi:hypothetical protein
LARKSPSVSAPGRQRPDHRPARHNTIADLKGKTVAAEPASRHGRVATEIEVDLPPNRTLATRRTADFLALRTEVEDLVRAYHAQVTPA